MYINLQLVFKSLAIVSLLDVFVKKLRQNKIRYPFISISNKINKGGCFVTILVIIGLFGPWIIKGYNSYGWIDPLTGLGELRYHSIIVLSPFFSTLTRDGNVEVTQWFISFGTSLSGLIQISSSLLCVLKHTRKGVNFVLSTISFLGFILFFLSLGRGLSIGIRTQIGWGLISTITGILFMFILSITDLM